MSANIDCHLSPAGNFDSWFEIYNDGDAEFKLGGLYISDTKDDLKKWKCPSDMRPVPARGYLVVWCGSNEIVSTNATFSLDIEGGSVFISDEEGNILACQKYPQYLNRASYSLKDDGTWGFTCNPTPGEGNDYNGYYNHQLSTPGVISSCVFDSGISFHVNYDNSCSLYYTTDGSTPTIDKGIKSDDGFFDLSETSFFKFRLFKDGEFPSEVETRVFIKKNHDEDLPIVSVVSSDNFLYSDSIGILVKGTHGKPGNGSDEPCNWNMDWERPATFSYFKDDKCTFQQDVNIEVHGGWTRNYYPKSLKIKANKKFGNKTLSYPFFTSKPYIRNKTIILRNGGNDNNCRIKDAALETILFQSGVDVDLQSYEPAIVYLNGKRIGVLNIREPSNKHYVYANYGLDDDEIDFFEDNENWKCGDKVCYDELYQLSKEAADDDTYEKIKSLLDIDEYANYLAMQLYLRAEDGWPLCNTKAFRYRNNGRFRLISLDLDYALRSSVFPSLTDSNKNQPRAAEIFLGLLKNDSFRKKFVDTYCIIGGSVYEYNRARNIVEKLSSIVDHAMADDGLSPWRTANSMISAFEQLNDLSITELKEFTPVMLQNSEIFHLDVCSDTEGATIKLNDIVIPYNEYHGLYFDKAKLTAIPPAGYKFVGWKDSNINEVLTMDVTIDADSQNNHLIACFEPDVNIRDVYPVMINEISAANDSYINDIFKKSDWVELYNTTNQPVDIEGMYISDDGTNLHKYKISKESGINTLIPAHGYLIVWCDKQSPVSQIHMPFKLDADGGGVFLTASDESYTDSLIYGIHKSDESICRLPDGGGGIYKTNVPTIGKRNMFTSYLQDGSGKTTSVISGVNVPGMLKIAQSGGYLHIETDASFVEVRIMNISGLCLDYVHGKAVDFNYYPLKEISAGIYIAIVTDSNGNRSVCKFVKE